MLKLIASAMFAGLLALTSPVRADSSDTITHVAKPVTAPSRSAHGTVNVNSTLEAITRTSETHSVSGSTVVKSVFKAARVTHTLLDSDRIACDPSQKYVVPFGGKPGEIVDKYIVSYGSCKPDAGCPNSKENNKPDTKGSSNSGGCPGRQESVCKPSPSTQPSNNTSNSGRSTDKSGGKSGGKSSGSSRR